MMKYDTYKDSGIDWLGEIPRHWRNYRVDWIGTIVRGNTGFRKDELLETGEYVALQYGKTYKVNEVDDSFKYFVNSEFYKKSQIAKCGDTIIVSTSETIEDLGHTCFYNREDLGLLGGEQILLKPNNKIIFEKYLYYYSNKFCDELKKYASGLKVFRFNTNDLKQIFIAIPLLEEQKIIAQYLDTKTRAIDKKVILLEQKIDKYKALRKSIINTTITKGLNLSVKQKYSGIDWIGEIPEHWKVKRCKDVFVEIKSRSKKGTEDLLSVSEYYGVAKKKDKLKGDSFLSTAKTLVGYKKCKKGDLIINIMLAWKKGLGVTQYDGIVSPAYGVYRQNGNNPQFYHYSFRTGIYTAEFKRKSKGIIDSRLRLYTDKFYTVPILCPPIDEQNEIVNYLDAKTGVIDKIIFNIDEQLKVLGKLRITLINDVVTGNLKVTKE